MADPLKPDSGKRMTRSQAISMTTPLASPLTAPLISPVTAHRKPWRLNALFWTSGVAMACLAAGYAAGSLWPWTSRKGIDTKDPAKLVELADHAVPLKPGPWGTLEAIPFYIEAPDEYLPVKAVEESSPVWYFNGYTPTLLTDVFEMADLTADQKALLEDQSKWKMTAQGIAIDPPEDLVLSLSAHSRKVIYGVLSLIPANAVAANRCYFPADKFDEFFAKTGLQPDIIAMVKRLSFPHGKLLFFCDAPLVLAKLDSYDEKLRLMKVLTRKSTLLLRLHIMPDTDIDALADYWAKGQWGKEFRPMLESLTEIPGGARVGVGRFFPPRTRDALYTFPYPSLSPDDAKKDCHWTALNFFNDTPDPRFLDVENVKQTLLRDYYPVSSDPRFGDILELVRPDGEAIHSCVFIADNVVYTKNSAQPTEPCMLMTIPDMLDAFSSLIPESETLRIITYRNKSY